MPLDEDTRAPYLQAAEVLRREITGGRLRPGDKLPSSRELQQQYKIASTTVQNALRVLREEGLIYSVQGKGSFVRRAAADTLPPVDQADEGAQGLTDEQTHIITEMLKQVTGQLHALQADVERMHQRIDRLQEQQEARQTLRADQ